MTEMIEIVLDLSERELKWLERRARLEGVSVPILLQQMIRDHRERHADPALKEMDQALRSIPRKTKRTQKKGEAATRARRGRKRVPSTH